MKETADTSLRSVEEGCCHGVILSICTEQLEEERERETTKERWRLEIFHCARGSENWIQCDVLGLNTKYKEEVTRFTLPLVFGPE